MTLLQFEIADKYLTLATVDRIFIATKVAVKEVQDLPERDMTRFEFYEALVRLAGAKYKDNKLEPNYISSFKRLLMDSIIPNTDLYQWHPWRKKMLWTIEIDDVLKANQENLWRVYRRYFTPKRKYMALSDAI